MKLKKICFVIFSSANYNSVRSVIAECKKSKRFNLQIIVGASATQDKFGDVYNRILRDGFKVNFKIENQFSSSELKSMVKTTGLGLIELSECFSKLKPDIVFTVGDRHETISTAIAASYMNILVAHTMGGEVTGTIDENVRHAITKLSHIHFVSNKDSMNRVIKLGELKKYVFNVGCPRNDLVKKIISKKNFVNEFKFISKSGVGDIDYISQLDDYFVILYHPVTTDIDVNKIAMQNILKATQKFNIKNIIIWPNSDAGSDEISKQIRIFREKGLLKNFKILKNLPIEYYIPLIKNSKCLVGNSSSAIRDGAFIGVPAVNVGQRQNNRLRSKNVIQSSNELKEIQKKIKLQYGKKFKSSKLYGSGNTGKNVVRILKQLKKFSTQKNITY
ncbi:UDP-N-acetylglucosamine 2-epimerase [Candidatus Pelagibacter sp. HIMB1748]|uniref:UDP-N-acetylglucosamine 2-epimerase n=1 Tax=unclassified Candidatus Pelagibacter TaxID=2647897 RepID=UPI003F830308